MSQLLTQDYVKSALDYNSETGIFHWKYRETHPANWNSRFAGKQAGSVVWCSGIPYININIDGHTYKAHRLAWLIVHGVWAEKIDHKNNCGLDNWIENLREATHSQNLANSSKTSRGVYWDRNAYRVAIRVNNQLIYLGRCATKEEGQEIYNRAADKYFGEFARNSRVA